MAGLDERGSKVLALARSGDVAGAIAVGEDVLAGGSADAGLAMFVGMLCCRQGDMPRGIGHLRRAVALAPHELGAKIELARALVATGANDEAEAIAAPHGSTATPAGREMQRIRAHALMRAARVAEAAALFEQLVDADGADFESWDGLGLARLTLGDASGAVAASLVATRLRPSAIAYWVNLARAQTGAGDFAAGAGAARRALALTPADVAAQLELGRALAGLGKYEEALASLAAARLAAPAAPEILSEIADIESTCKAFDRAEAGYRAALAIRPDIGQAWLGLGRLLERTNRGAELLDTLDAAEGAGASARDTALLRAQALRGEGRLEEALASARAAPDDVAPAVRAQLIGDIADRLGDADTAFAAFTEANQLLAAAATGSAETAATYLDKFRRLSELLTPAYYAGWSPPASPGPRAAPLFIFGFPRSGTTLIDTMLSGHPDAVVLEEEPTIDTVAKALGPFERLPDLPPAEIARLRSLYFAEVAKVAPDAGDRLIVDKHPLSLSSTPLLHRLFPDARFVFVERHPCDVVLSCFITSAQMDANVANFFNFEGTARLYDQVLSYWQRCCAVLPLRVHRIRYEQLIAGPEAELRRLAEFAGLAWTPQLLANQSNAAARAYIGSPSYAQVAEPLYTRAAGRWRRYRRHMDAVIPILAPWVARLGYDL